MHQKFAIFVALLPIAARAALLTLGADAPSIVIEGQVKATSATGADEAPVAGGHVWAFLQGAEPGKDRPGSTRKQTDKTGKFHFDLTPGRYALVIHSGLTREFVPSSHFGLGDASRVNTLLARTSYDPSRKPLSVAMAKSNLEEIRKAIPQESAEKNDLKEYKEFVDNWITDLDTIVKEPVNILVPAYFNPSNRPDDWKKIVQAAEKHKGKLQLVVILNPSNGPGTKVDPSYTASLKACAKAGVRVIGYIALNFGKAPEADLRKAVDNYYKWYPQVEGFFLDELDDGEPNFKIIRGVVTHARAGLKPAKGLGQRTALLVGNPGKTIGAGPLVKDRVLDALIVYENDGKSVPFVPPDWAGKQKIGTLVYNLQNEEHVRRIAAGLLQTGVNMLYITDASRTNPDVPFGEQWGRLPKYWDAFLEAAEAR